MSDTRQQSVDLNESSTRQKKLGGITGKGFMPGVSGNPGGVPKDKPFTDICKKLLASQKNRKIIMETLRSMISDKRSKLALDAMNTMADRVEGETVKRVEHGGPDGEPLTISVKIVKPKEKE